LEGIAQQGGWRVDFPKAPAKWQIASFDRNLEQGTHCAEKDQNLGGGRFGKKNKLATVPKRENASAHWRKSRRVQEGGGGGTHKKSKNGKAPNWQGVSHPGASNREARQKGTAGSGKEDCNEGEKPKKSKNYSREEWKGKHGKQVE